MSQSSELTVARTEQGYVVAVVGQGTRIQSPAVRDFISGALEDGASVVLDLSACNYLDSTFLGCLVILHKRSAAKESGCDGQRFCIHAGEEVVQKLLHPTRLDSILTCNAQPPATTGEAVPLPVVDLERKEFGKHLLDTHEELAAVDSPSSAAFRLVCDQLRNELGEGE